jgi:Fe-S cluster assembly iron-binding protein IscA
VCLNAFADQHWEDVVLTLTEDAVKAIEDLATNSTLRTESAGLRIVASTPIENHAGSRLSLTLSQGPHGGDQVVEAGAARVFLEASAAQVLDDKRLDATTSPDGDVTFRLEPQR